MVDSSHFIEPPAMPQADQMNTSDRLWAECRDDFEDDGSLLEIYVDPVTLADWDRFLQCIRSDWRTVDRCQPRVLDANRIPTGPDRKDL